MGIQHLDWEGCSPTGGHTDQVLLQASALCYSLISYKAHVHRGTPAHFSTLQQCGYSSTRPLSDLWAESTF